MTTRKTRAPSSRRPPGAAGARRHARVFWTGRSQAVRLPKEMRFSTTEVTVRKEGGRLILEPLEIKRDSKGWPIAFWEIAGAAPDFSVGDRSVPHERKEIFRPR